MAAGPGPTWQWYVALCGPRGQHRCLGLSVALLGAKGDGTFVGLGLWAQDLPFFNIFAMSGPQRQSCAGKPGGVGVNGTLLPHPPPQSLGGSMRLRSHPGMGSYRAKESGGSLEAGFLRETQGLEPGCALPVRLRSQMHRLSWEGHLCCWLN